MSILFIDGFDTYADPTTNNDVRDVLLSSLYASVQGAYGIGVGNGSGYSQGYPAPRTSYGAYAIPYDHPIFPTRFRRATKTSTGYVVGFALYFSNGSVSPFNVLYDNLIGTTVSQWSLFLNDVAGISIRDGTGALIVATDPNIIFPHTWNYIEVKIIAGISDGVVEVRLNGNTVAVANGVRTVKPGAASYYNLVEFVGQGSCLFDDVYILDLTGATFNDFQGDCVVHGILPASDAGPNQMSQFGGNVTGHYSSVNNVPPDEETSYLYTTAPGAEELFNLDVLPNDILEVLAVSIHVRARKDSAGIAHYKIEGKLGANLVQSETYAVTTNYLTKQLILPAKPGGGLWTKTEAQALKIGFVSA